MDQQTLLRKRPMQSLHIGILVRPLRWTDIGLHPDTQQEAEQSRGEITPAATTLSSFRFVGQGGLFTAHRGYNNHGQQTRFWSASRCVRRHTYKHYLGVTESLTIASLEHIAARLQADIDAR
jgi:hypothetical protein